MNSDSARAGRFLRHLEPLQGAMEAYCRQSLHDPQSVEDALQNALTDAFRNFHLYVENTNFRAWIFRYLNLEILEQNRRTAKSRSQEALSAELVVSGGGGSLVSERLLSSLVGDPEAVLEHCDAALAQAVAELGPRDRSVLFLRAIGEFKYGEIAEILEVPVGTVMSSLARTRERLRRKLADYGRQQGLLGGDT